MVLEVMCTSEHVLLFRSLRQPCISVHCSGQWQWAEKGCELQTSLDEGEGKRFFSACSIERWGGFCGP